LDSLLANAERILEAAEASARANCAPGDWTVLVGRGGEIEMVAGSDWGLEALRSERGAAMAFRVGEARGRVTVDGRTAGRACRLEAETPAAVARRLLGHTLPVSNSQVPLLLPGSR
jgi:hypothetical protein